jgi:nitrogen fixation NifU-like protein
VSEGLELYQAAIVDAARRAGEHPRLAAPHGSATVDNPLCGDRVTTDVEMERSEVVRVGQRVRGCLLCEASAVLIAEHAPGMDAGAAAALEAAVSRLLEGQGWPDDQGEHRAFSTFAPVAGFRSRHRCVLLPFEALREALVDAGGHGSGA